LNILKVKFFGGIRLLNQESANAQSTFIREIIDISFYTNPFSTFSTHSLGDKQISDTLADFVGLFRNLLAS
jgi:hypothetical protein